MGAKYLLQRWIALPQVNSQPATAVLKVISRVSLKYLGRLIHCSKSLLPAPCPCSGLPCPNHFPDGRPLFFELYVQALTCKIEPPSLNRRYDVYHHSVLIFHCYARAAAGD